jgi:multidrug transporter EmrE-like cation transporter
MRNAAFLLCYLVFVTAANIFLKMSADAGSAWLFIEMQVAGNLSGFVGILAYTGLLRKLPLHVAFPLSRGMAVLGVQVIASLVVFHEVFRLREAVGMVLVAIGVVLVGVSAARPKEAGA